MFKSLMGNNRGESGDFDNNVIEFLNSGKTKKERHT